MDKVSKARGAFLGMAMGESRGAPFTGLSQKDIELQGGIPDWTAAAKHFQITVHARRIQRGAYEDDTQAALCVTDVLLRENKVNPATLSQRFADLGQPMPGFFFGCWRRPHRNMRVSVRRMLEGTPWQECALPSAGMGAASRGVPLGLRFQDDEQLAEGCILAGLITHNDPRALTAAATVAGLVRGAMATSPDELDETQLLADILKLVRRTEALLREKYSASLAEGTHKHIGDMGDAIEHISGLMNEPLSAVFSAIIERSAPLGARAITTVNGGFAVAAIPALLYMVLTDNEDFGDGVDGVIGEGGATDTMGALAGAFLGALHGVNAIPREWNKILPNGQQLEMRAAALVGSPAGILTPLIVMEAQVTRPIRVGAMQTSAKRFRGKVGPRSRDQVDAARERRPGGFGPRRGGGGGGYGGGGYRGRPGGGYGGGGGGGGYRGRPDGGGYGGGGGYRGRPDGGGYDAPRSPGPYEDGGYGNRDSGRGDYNDGNGPREPMD